MDMLSTAIRQGLLYAHLVAFAFAFVTVLREDVALMRARYVDKKQLHSTARMTALLLVLLWLTGAGLIFLDVGLDWTPLLAKPKMVMKLTVVTVLTLNGVLLHFVAFPMLTTPQASTRRAAAVCTVLGAVSTTSWAYASFVGVARLVAPTWRLVDFMSLYLLALVGSLAIGWLGVRPHLRRLMSTAANLQAAQLPSRASLADFDFERSPVSQELVQQLAQGTFIERSENVWIVGPPSSGKTHLAVAIGRAAIEDHRRRVRYFTAVDLVQTLELEKVNGHTGRLAASLKRVRLVIIDGFGYTPLREPGAALLLSLISKLQGRVSLVVVIRQGFERWGHVFGDSLASTTALQRFSQSVHVLRTSGAPRATPVLTHTAAPVSAPLSATAAVVKQPGLPQPQPRPAAAPAKPLRTDSLRAAVTPDWSGAGRKPGSRSGAGGAHRARKRSPFGRWVPQANDDARSFSHSLSPS